MQDPGKWLRGAGGGRLAAPQLAAREHRRRSGGAEPEAGHRWPAGLAARIGRPRANSCRSGGAVAGSARMAHEGVSVRAYRQRPAPAVD
jgi:hypothetical protein